MATKDSPISSPGVWKILLEMLAYALQVLGLMTMPFAVGVGIWVRSNQGLWLELWIALTGITLFFAGRMLSNRIANRSKREETD